MSVCQVVRMEHAIYSIQTSWNVINTLFTKLLLCLQADVIHQRQNVGLPDLENAWSNAHFSAKIVECLVLCPGIVAVSRPFAATCTVYKCCQYGYALAMFIYTGILHHWYNERYHLMQAFYCTCKDTATVLLPWVKLLQCFGAVPSALSAVNIACSICLTALLALLEYQFHFRTWKMLPCNFF